jgi:hypothetical protein
MFERPHQILQSRLDIRIVLLGQNFHRCSTRQAIADLKRKLN